MNLRCPHRRSIGLFWDPFMETEAIGGGRGCLLSTVTEGSVGKPRIKPWVFFAVSCMSHKTLYKCLQEVKNS